MQKLVWSMRAAPWIRHCYISEMVEDRWVHATMRLTSIEFSFDPCNFYCDGPRGIGYPADARSVGNSHPSCSTSYGRRDSWSDVTCITSLLHRFTYIQTCSTRVRTRTWVRTRVHFCWTRTRTWTERTWTRTTHLGFSVLGLGLGLFDCKWI